MENVKGYVAIVLSPESKALLAEHAIHAGVFAHHVTLAFRPSQADFDEKYAPLLGKSLRLNVTGIATDDKGQAAAVELPEEVPCANAHPHVTISCADGVKPFYSNELLANANVVSEEFQLDATVEFVPFN